MKILALDDDAITRRILSKILSENYNFMSVSSCKEFFLSLDKFCPDIVLLDKILSDGDGIEVCKKISENRKYDDLLILILTGSNDKDSIKEGYESGAYDYIIKPFDAFAVKAKIINCNKIINYQQKIVSSNRYQFKINKNLFMLNKLFQQCIDITTMKDLLSCMNSFNDIVDIIYLEFIINEKGLFKSYFSKAFDKSLKYRSFKQLNKKLSNKFDLPINRSFFKIKTGLNDNLYCCVFPIYNKKNIPSFFLYQKINPFTKYDKKLLSLFSRFITIMDERLVLEKRLKDQYTLFRSEIAKIREIQVSRLPDFNNVNGYNIKSSFLPVEELSGDFFDGFFLDNYIYQIVMCDVSGHGIASSYFGNEIRTLFRTTSSADLKPSSIIKSLNTRLIKDFGEALYFSAVIVCQINIKTGYIFFSSGGHPLSLLYCFRKKQCIELSSTGGQIGICKDMEYKDVKFVLEKGDCLLFYTDGVNKSQSEKCEKMYSKEQLIESYLEDIDSNPLIIIQTIIGSIFEFIDYSNQVDDITLICMKKE